MKRKRRGNGEKWAPRRKKARVGGEGKRREREGSSEEWVANRDKEESRAEEMVGEGNKGEGAVGEKG